MWQNGAEEGTNTKEQTKPQRNRPKSDDGRSTVENTEEGVSSCTNEKEHQLEGGDALVRYYGTRVQE